MNTDERLQDYKTIIQDKIRKLSEEIASQTSKTENKFQMLEIGILNRFLKQVNSLILRKGVYDESVKI